MIFTMNKYLIIHLFIDMVIQLAKLLNSSSARFQSHL